jgi:squalene-hopene/tetraprenyl-beta-curcumene cyclase
MRRFLVAISVIGMVAAIGVTALAASSSRTSTPTWDTDAAARYLDHAEERWATWPRASLEQGTFCVSCHTAALYAVARPALRAHINDKNASSGEIKLIDNVLKRLNAWNEIAPYYPDQRFGLPKTSESRGSEAVINALVLAARDASAGTLSEDTRRAFKNMWYLQMQRGDVTGSWPWMNFHLDPWEGDRSAYYGASLAALAVGMAPSDYAKTPDIQENLKALSTYLQKNADKEYLFNTATALWAAGYLPEILQPGQKQAITDKLVGTQAPDGGWSMSVMGDWKRSDGSPADTASDGYATAVAVLALKKSGNPSARASTERGTAWLMANQDKSGMWRATSVNKRREIREDYVPGYFMIDAATAMAVLALTASP